MQDLSRIFYIRAFFSTALLLVCSRDLASWLGSPDGNHLGDNTDGNFFRQNRIDVNAHGRKHAIELLLSDALFQQVLKQGPLLEAAADHSNESSLGVHGPSQYRLVFEVSTSDNDKIRKLVWKNSGEG